MIYYVQVKIDTDKYNEYKESSDRDAYKFNKDLIREELPDIADKIEEIYVSCEDDWFLGADECNDTPAYLFKLNIEVNEKLSLGEKHDLHNLLNKTCTTNWNIIMHFDN